MTDARNHATEAAPGYENMLFALCNPANNVPEEFSEADRQGVGRETGARVQIPPSPPNRDISQEIALYRGCFLFQMTSFRRVKF